MKNNITKIKNILKIIISILIIVSMIKSCGYATEEIKETCLEKLLVLKQQGVLPANFNENINLNHLNGNNITGFIIVLGRGNNNNYEKKLTTQADRLYIIPRDTTIRTIGNYSNNTSNQGYNDWTATWDTARYTVVGEIQQSGTWAFNNLKEPFYVYNYSYDTIATRVLNLEPFGEHGGNYFSKKDLEFVNAYEEQTTTFNNVETTYYQGDLYSQTYIKLGEIENLNDTVYYEIRLKNQNNIILGTIYDGPNINTFYDNALYKVGNYIYARTLNLKYNTTYTLEIDSYLSLDAEPNNIQEIYTFFSEDTVIQNGTIEQLGSGDFTNQDTAIQIIDNITDNIYSNNSGEKKGIVQKIYDDLFTISGDYIQNKIEELKDNNNIGNSGDLEIDKMILNVIQEQHNDFIISWDTVGTHLSIQGQQLQNQLIISGDRINFSQMERQNEYFHEIMNWTRTILGFTFTYLLVMNYWKTLMLTLGVGIQVYEKNEQVFDKKENKGDKK